MIEDGLRKLGFTGNEVKIYLCLLRLGKAKAGDLIKETGLQRSVVYNGLEELLSRELITKTVNKGIAVYLLNDPEALTQEEERRMLLAKKVSEQLKEKQQIRDREVAVYEGDDIVKRVADKSLEAPKGSIVYFLGPSKFGVQANLERYWQRYHTLRAQKGIECRLLYDKTTSPEIVAERNASPLCEARYLPFETHIPMSFIVTDSLVGMLVPSENPPLAFLIKSVTTADALKNYFQYLWKQSSQT